MVIEPPRKRQQGPVREPFPDSVVVGGEIMVRRETDSRDVGEPGGAPRRGDDGAADADIHHEQYSCVRDVGPGGGDSMPGTGWAAYAHGFAEAVVGPAGERAGGEDRGGLEEEGEEREWWIVGGDSEAGEGRAVVGGLSRLFHVPLGRRQGGGDGGAGGGAGGDMCEDGGRSAAAAASD